MIGEYHYAEIISAALKIFKDRSQYLFVDKLYSKHLVFGLSPVPAFIGSFDVNINKI